MQQDRRQDVNLPCLAKDNSAGGVSGKLVTSSCQLVQLANNTDMKHRGFQQTCPEIFLHAKGNRTTQDIQCIFWEGSLDLSYRSHCDARESQRCGCGVDLGLRAKSTRPNCSATNQKLNWKELPVVCLPLLSLRRFNARLHRRPQAPDEPQHTTPHPCSRHRISSCKISLKSTLVDN